MKLIEFVDKFIEHNSIVRLLYKTKNGHECVLDSWDDVSMEHEILKYKGKYKKYINNEVISIASILVTSPSHYSDAINIIIEKIEEKEFRRLKLTELEKNNN